MFLNYTLEGAEKSMKDRQRVKSGKNKKKQLKNKSADIWAKLFEKKINYYSFVNIYIL